MRIGTMFLGQVEALGQESIVTKFFILGLPVVPLESYYCTRRTFRGIEGFPIPLHRKSVLFGYVRPLLVALTLLAGVFAFVDGSLHLAILAALGAGLVLASAWLGRLSPTEKRRRQVLGQVTGVSAPPSIFDSGWTSRVRDKLEERWQSLTKGTSLQDWRNASSMGAVDSRLLPLLFCLALYAGEQGLAERAWQDFEHDRNHR